MNFKLLGTAGLLACSFLTMANAQEPNGISLPADTDVAPNGITPLARGGIIYHGGPVLGTVAGSPVHLYYIFYGNWAGLDPNGEQILKDFGNSLGGSPYWNILTTYVESNGSFIHNALTLAGTTSDNYSQGTNLNDTTLQTVVKTAINNGSLPLDTNAIYHVLTTSDVNETSGFCSAYCGFHNHMTFNGSDIKYSFIGNPVHCTAQGGVADCQGDSHNITHSPNNDPGVDAMISVLAHESEEATSDPDLNAWYFRNGQEDGDKCAYMYGTTFPESNGSDGNVHMGTRDYLIQENWIAKTGAQKCAIKYP